MTRDYVETLEWLQKSSDGPVSDGDIRRQMSNRFDIYDDLDRWVGEAFARIPKPEAPK